VLSAVNEDEDEDAQGDGHAVLLLVNPSGRSRRFILPPVAKGIPWRLFIDTNATPPLDVYPQLDGPLLGPLKSVTLDQHSLQCFVASE
jgi:glycogen operon protein